MNKEIILQERQEEITLDSALVRGVSNHEHGCKFKLVVMADGTVCLTEGCSFGTMSRSDSLLLEWLHTGPYYRGSSIKGLMKLTGVVSELIIESLLKRDSCLVCGGDMYELREPVSSVL